MWVLTTVQSFLQSDGKILEHGALVLSCLSLYLSTSPPAHEASPGLGATDKFLLLL